MISRGWLGVCCGVLLAVFGGTAAAQDVQGESRVHFDRGVTLYEEGHLTQALAEFREAYRIAPAPGVLYNVAQVEAELGHAVEAVAAYEQILGTATTIQPGLRAQIESALATQRTRIGTLRVSVSVPGALVALDDQEIGAAPLADVPVSAGEHVVSARADGYETVRYRFLVAGGATHEARLTLTLTGAAIGSIRVDCRVPGIEVVIDGTSYGLTPLASAVALPAGSHRVEGRRMGYTPFSQDVTVAPGSESRAGLIVETDPSTPDSELGTLRLALPTASTQLRVDGAPADVTSARSLLLPAGLHDIEVRAADRETFSRRIDVLAEEVFDLRPPYEWTPEARESRVQGARSQTEIGWGLVIGGGVVGIAGAIATILVWADYSNGTGRANDVFRASCQDWRTMWGSPPMGSIPAMPSAYETTCRTQMSAIGVDIGATDSFGGTAYLRDLPGRVSSALNLYNVEMGVAGSLAALGGIALVTGIVLIAIAPSESAIDRAARASRFDLRLSGGLGSLTLSGSF